MTPSLEDHRRRNEGPPDVDREFAKLTRDVAQDDASKAH